jgi:hypothetical protein
MGDLQKQQEQTCIATGVCAQLNRPNAPAVIVHWVAIAISNSTGQMGG